MRAVDFHQEYRNLWPEVANASLLVDLYRAQGATDPERMAVQNYVKTKDVEKAIALLRKINEVSCKPAH
jgi:pentatricopeptide repeat protein